MLVSAKEMLQKAKAGHYAVGQFNINKDVYKRQVFQLGVAGAGLATVFSQSLAAVLTIRLSLIHI